VQLCQARPELEFIAYVNDDILTLISSKHLKAFKIYKRNCEPKPAFLSVATGFEPVIL
jgi:hypothetical protein